MGLAFRPGEDPRPVHEGRGRPVPLRGGVPPRERRERRLRRASDPRRDRPVPRRASRTGTVRDPPREARGSACCREAGRAKSPRTFRSCSTPRASSSNGFPTSTSPCPWPGRRCGRRSRARSQSSGLPVALVDDGAAAPLPGAGGRHGRLGNRHARACPARRRRRSSSTGPPG